MHNWPSILALAFAFQEPQSNTTIKNLSVAKCDIEELLMPLNADKWTCDKPIYQTKVKKNTRCITNAIQRYPKLNQLQNQQ